MRFWRVVSLRDRPLAIRLLVYSTFLIVVPMLFIGVVAYRRSATALEEQAKAYNLRVIEQVILHVEYYINDLEINLLRVVDHPDMRLYFASEHEGTGVSAEQGRRALAQLLRSAVFSRSDLFAITVLTNEGETVETAGVLGAYPAENVRGADWFDDIPDNGESLMVTRLIPFRDRIEPTLSIVQRLTDPMTLEPAGLIVVDVNYKRLREIAEKVVIGRTGHMFILDSRGRYLYHPDFSLLGRPAVYSALSGQSGGSVVTRIGGERRLLTFSRSLYLDWTIGTDIDYDDVVRDTKELGLTIGATVSATLVVSSAAGVWLAAGIVRPLRRLQRFMRRVETGDFNAECEVQSRDEIGSLTLGFNRMVERLRRLHEEVYASRLKEAQANLRQKEAELKMLEAQIHPHFLYNSLETIRGMALEGGRDDIADISEAMAKLLRYNLQPGRPFVMLEDELAVCELYLRIQRHRFADRLAFEIDVPSWARGQFVARFLLQPIVENSVVHGVEPAGRPVRIRLTAGGGPEGGSKVWWIAVEDDGAGMAPERLQEIREALADARDATSPLGRIGLWNVHRRIAHLFGEEFGVSIESERGRGTVVTLRLPYGFKDGDR